MVTLGLKFCGDSSIVDSNWKCCCGSNDFSRNRFSNVYILCQIPRGRLDTELTPQNSPVAFTVTIPFVNPSLHQTSVRMSNFSLQSGELNLGFDFSANSVYNLEACLASADVNSTIVVPIPSSIGRGEMLLNGNIHNATVSIKGITSETFSFWYELDYSYSYSGNVTGELISQDVTTISSSNALFTTVDSGECHTHKQLCHTSWSLRIERVPLAMVLV